MSNNTSNCAVEGGCPSDYVAISISSLCMILLLIRSSLPFLVNKVPRRKGSVFWLLLIQIYASFNLLFSIMMAGKFLKFKRTHWWQSCYMWAGWFEGPLGFGLLTSCRIVQALKLYYLFVKRRLSPVKTYVLLPLILLPWIGLAACLHIRKPLNSRCHNSSAWIIPVISLHILYVAAMVGITQAVRHIEFRFHEFKDLLQGIVVSTIVIGIWIASYVMNELHDDNAWLQLTSRFLLLATAGILVLAFYSASISQPLISQMSLKRGVPHDTDMMGRALGVPDSGLLLQMGPKMEIDANVPLDKLLQYKRFRRSFMAFADSCLAGESVHFYDEVHDLSMIPVNESVSRVYMARHIIEKYVVSGAVMEVNISHRTRQEIMGSLDLAHPNLFNNAVNELMQLMKTNLAKDYWSSTFFVKLKEESSKPSDNHEFFERMVGWDYSPRLSAVHNGDDPFHQEHPSNV